MRSTASLSCLLMAISSLQACEGSKPVKGTGLSQGSEANHLRIRRLSDGRVEVELSSDRLFPAINSIPVLQIGSQEFTFSRYPEGDMHTLIFTLTADEFARTRNGDRVLAKYDPESPDRRWDFGLLIKEADR